MYFFLARGINDLIQNMFVVLREIYVYIKYKNNQITFKPPFESL